MNKLIRKYSSGAQVQQGFETSSLYGIIPTVGGLLNYFDTPNSNLNTNQQIAGQTRDVISSALMMSGNPWAMAGGLLYKGLDKLGTFSDASEGLGAGNDAVNTIASLIPGLKYLTPKTNDYAIGGSTQALQRGFAGTFDDNQLASKNAGSHFIFGGKKANRMINTAQIMDDRIDDIKQSRDADIQSARSLREYKTVANQNALLGYNPAYARVGKFGLKLERTKQLSIKFKEPSEIKEQEVYVMKDGGEFFNKIKEEFVPTTEEQNKEFFENLIPEFKEGGQMNVIPEGSLHARLHHMENADNLTKKGIPVVDNEGNQQAEIEHSEIIFTNEVTEKLEELYKKFKSDEYTNKEKENFAIEAGKLLSKEIIENTDDRVGLLNDNENETLANN